jgi:hypothetical protein
MKVCASLFAADRMQTLKPEVQEMVTRLCPDKIQ